jgi:hypothetical protein
MFYLTKARKVKNAAKIITRLDEYDLDDVHTYLEAEKVIQEFIHL